MGNAHREATCLTEYLFAAFMVSGDFDNGHEHGKIFPGQCHPYRVFLAALIDEVVNAPSRLLSRYACLFSRLFNQYSIPSLYFFVI